MKGLKPQQQARNRWNLDKIIAFDMETSEWEADKNIDILAIGMYKDSTDEYYKFVRGNGYDDNTEMIHGFVKEMLRSKWDNHTFVAHNGGNFDFIPIISTLIDLSKIKPDMEIDILTKGPNDTPFYVDITTPEGYKMYLQDSIALMPRSLKSLSEAFIEDENLRKQDFDVKNLPSIDEMSREEIDEMLEYMKYDCISLYKCIEEFTKIIYELSDGLVGPQLTISSTTMAIYRVAFMKQKEKLDIIPTSNFDTKVNPEEKFRESYFGGRTEVIRMYANSDMHGDLRHYDVSSLYPYAYSQFKLPVGKVNRIPESKIDSIIGNDKYGGTVKISGYVPEHTYIPVLPARHDTGDNYEKVVFPSGKIEGWYMLREVRYALENGNLQNLDIHDGFMSKNQYAFKQFGGTLYDKKNTIDKHTNPALYIVVKLLLNGFYGKFGMQREQSKIVIGNPTDLDFIIGKEIINQQLLEKGVMLDNETAQSAYILPRIASAITAQARIVMHDYFVQCLDKGGDIWYCDTDSIITNVELEENAELGGMDLEHTLEEAYFLRPKTYAEITSEEEIIKAKGMRKIKDTFDNFRQAYHKNDPNEIDGSKWVTPRGLSSGLKAKIAENELDAFSASKQERSLRGFDDKRIHEDNQSKPIHID